ncbi:MAG: PhoH family protein [Desulfoplanes sp.]|nr:PhoH family protein [Desulfoplanes sp.]
MPKNITLTFEDAESARELFGPREKNLRYMMTKTGVDIQTRSASVFVAAADPERVECVRSCLSQLYELVRSGHKVYSQDVDCALRVLAREPQTSLVHFFRDNHFIVSPKKTISPRTLTQRDYLAAIRKNDLTFGIGPAGTGKTYLAVAVAVSSFLKKEVKRVVLTRPAVEAGEKLGFLPGDLVEKITPYLRPLYDALHDMLEFERVQEMLETGLIEIAPLAFMRGRTLNNAFVILDEAQNTTPEQMKMFLTRLGFGSKAVVTGDVTQIDLPGRAPSGLVQASGILKGIEGIDFVQFQKEDVIRHPLVGRIVQAYERFSAGQKRYGGSHDLP